MSEFALTAAERALLQALDELEVPFLLVGMGAALVQIPLLEAALAARRDRGER